MADSDTLTAPLSTMVTFEGQTLAYLIRAAAEPEKTTFVTPNEANFQAGFIVYPAGHEIPRHVHKPLERQIVGTSEALLVRKGSLRVDFYTDDQRYAGSEELKRGDLILFLAGGHGFELHDDCVLLEIKQGPYIGIDEKIRF